MFEAGTAFAIMALLGAPPEELPVLVAARLSAGTWSADVGHTRFSGRGEPTSGGAAQSISATGRELGFSKPRAWTLELGVAGSYGVLLAGADMMMSFAGAQDAPPSNPSVAGEVDTGMLTSFGPAVDLGVLLPIGPIELEPRAGPASASCTCRSPRSRQRHAARVGSARIRVR